MEKIFTIQRNENDSVLFNLKGIHGLKSGDIFFKQNKDKTTEVLQDFEYLSKDYLSEIIDKLSEEERYNFCLLENKTLL